MFNQGLESLKTIADLQYDEDELMARGKFVRPAFWGKIQSEPLQEFSKPLWDITLAESQEKGAQRTPYLCR